MQEHAALSDVGRMRPGNEDSYVVVPLLDGLLCAVADGMGGHAAGEVASKLAVEAIERAGRNIRLGEPALPLLEAAVDEAHAGIRKAASNGREGMGCTLTVAAVRPGQLEVLHIGDSRAYLVGEGRIEQLTDDDSLVGELLRQELITADEARYHPARSVLTRALGVGEVADFATFTAEPRANDVLLLCSDGLTTHLGDEDIRTVIEGAKSLKVGAEQLAATANERGGSDNITVILARTLPGRG